MFKTMSNKNSDLKGYHIAICYLCQTCLHCNKNINLLLPCRCDLQKIPRVKKGSKRNYFAKTFYASSSQEKQFNSWQIKELQYFDDKYDYNTDFSEDFKISLCSSCYH